jgi:hypothetical protein
MEDSVLLTKMDAMSDVIASHFDENKEAHAGLFKLLDAHNGRLSKVERSWNMMIGALVFSSVVLVPIVLTVINHWITQK